MNNDTGKHGLIGKVGNRGNWFRTNVEPNSKFYFHEVINFSVPFATLIIGEI